MAGRTPYRNSDETATLAYLGRRPYDNAYPAWLLQTHQIGRSDDVMLWRDDGDEIAGFALVTSRMIVCADSERAAQSFAALAAARVQDPRMIVGPKDTIDAFWAEARARMPKPLVVRTRQPIFAVSAATLRTAAPSLDLDIGRATADEADALAIESAHMTSGELGYLVTPNAAYRKRTAGIIAAGWYWRAYARGKLAFICHVGAATEHTAQVQGVWTPPEMRGHGYAARAFATMCATLLERYRTLSLYVNEYNASAIALYERVGFTRRGTMSTIVFA